MKKPEILLSVCCLVCLMACNSNSKPMPLEDIKAFDVEMTLKSEPISIEEKDSIINLMEQSIQTGDRAKLDDLFDSEMFIYRVRDKCGKLDSDIISKIDWALLSPIKSTFSSLISTKYSSKDTLIINNSSIQNEAFTISVCLIKDNNFEVLEFELFKFKEDVKIVDFLNYKHGFYSSDMATYFIKNQFTGPISRSTEFSYLNKNSAKGFRGLQLNNDNKDFINRIPKHRFSEFIVLQKQLDLLHIFPKNEQVEILNRFIEKYHDQTPVIHFHKAWKKDIESNQELSKDDIYNKCSQIL